MVLYTVWTNSQFLKKLSDGAWIKLHIACSAVSPGARILSTMVAVYVGMAGVDMFILDKEMLLFSIYINNFTQLINSDHC